MTDGDPNQILALVQLCSDTDWLVSMRSLDLLEKLAHEIPERVQPHRKIFIGPLADSPKWEIRLQIVRALPVLRWTTRERKRVLSILVRDSAHPQLFVRAWAADALAQFAVDDPSLRPILLKSLHDLENSGRPALLARARQIRQTISGSERAASKGRHVARAALAHYRQAPWALTNTADG